MRRTGASIKQEDRKNDRPGSVERVEPDPQSPWWGEHRSRYRFACAYVAEKEVLDIACGTGYGTCMLADAGALHVVGVDVTAENLPPISPTVAFCLADGSKIPIKDWSFDVITSFETVEHIQHDEAFIAELRRVLRPEGIVFVSTPNALQSPQSDGRPANPFHVREYGPDEFRKLLQQHFSDVDLRGQRTGRHYPVSPFWERDELVGKDLRRRFALVTWKLQNRLPFTVKDRWSQLVHKRPFYPGEDDFEFHARHLEAGHVLLAICRP